LNNPSANLHGPRDRWWLVAFCCLSFFLSSAAVRLTATASGSDELEYHRLAVNLLAGQGYVIEPGTPITSRPPLYPALLALVYALFGPHDEAMWYLQAVLKSLTVFPVYCLGKRIFTPSVGLWAAGLYAVYPSFEMVATLYRENLVTILLTGFLWALTVGIQDRRSGAFLTAGALAGCLTLTNTIFLFLPLALCLLGFFDRRVRPQGTRLVGMMLIALLVYLPWQVRNALLVEASDEERAFQHLVLMFGHYPVFAGTFWWTLTDMRQLEVEREEARTLVRRLDESRPGMPLAERIADDRRELLGLILARPFSYLKFVVNRDLIFLVSPPPGTTMARRIHPVLPWLAFGANLLFVGGAVLCLLRAHRADASSYGVVGTLAYLLVVYGLLHSIRRYGYVMAPIWCLYGAAALEVVKTQVTGWRRVRPAAA
jgi:4-amino-4-deoxy-L-arabinose transferase-like glycosyltransferase